jgi:hypothetical protein
MKAIRHLSYANVMSTLAIFLVLGGAGAYAAKQKIGASKLKASAVTTAKIKNKAVTTPKLRSGAVSAEKLADGAVGHTKLVDGAVSSAKIANDAVTGDKVVESTLGEVPSANSANPLAFARVISNGAVDPALSKALTGPNVSHPSKGVYCIVAPFVPRGGHVTTESSSSQTTAQIAIGGGGKCGAGSVLVSTWNPDAVPPGPADVTFYVALYR